MKLLAVFAFALVAGCAGTQQTPAQSAALESERRAVAERNKQIESLKQKQAARGKEEKAQKLEEQNQVKLQREADKKAADKKISDRHFGEFKTNPSAYLQQHAPVISAFEAMATKCEINYRVYGRLDASKKRECIRMFEMTQEPEQFSSITLIATAAQALNNSNAMSFDQRITVREAEKGMKALKTIFLY